MFNTIPSHLHSRHSVAQALLTAILVLLAVGIAAAAGPSAPANREPEVVARVNGEPVTRTEMQRGLADPVIREQLQKDLSGNGTDGKELERLAMRRLIGRRLLLQEAHRRNMTVTEQELDQAVLNLRRRFGDLDSFGVWFRDRGLDEKSLFDFMRDEILISRVSAALVEGVRVTREQVQEYYEAHKDDLKTAGDVRLRIIAVREKGEAEEIVAALKKGEAFDRLARERSIGLRAAQGGDTGWVNPETLPSPLKETVNSLKPGEASRPLQRGDDFLIVGLAARKPERTKSLDEARQEIERRLLPAEQQKVFQAWLAEQERNAKIEVFP